MGGADTMRDRALHLASLGFRVFKLRPNEKLPAVSDFHQAATSDPAKVRAMWTDPVSGESTTHNVGVLSGADAKLLILDVDTKDGKQGDKTLAALAKEHGLDVATLTAITPTGGKHLFYRIKGDREVSGHANRLGPGLDVRGRHQYVAGVGSVLPKGEYDWFEAGAPILDAPEWLVDRCQQRKREAAKDLGAIELDAQHNVKRAIEWLESSAPIAVSGGGGNDATFKIACRVKDFGLTAEYATDVLLDHWNDSKAFPPWEHDELQRVVENAYRYAQTAPGATAAEAEFDEVILEVKPELDWPAPTPLKRFDVNGLPARQWIVTEYLARKFVSALISPGGVGKTSLVIGTLLAVASNNESPINHKIIERVPCWYWNQEDDQDELKRRLGAAMKHFNLGWQDLEHESRPMLYIDSGVDKPLTLIKKIEGGLYINKAVARIVEHIKARQIGLFVIDPLAEFHEAEENSNPDMRVVWGIARRIAVEANCSVLVVAHSRKPPQASSEGYTGDIDGLRGASSQAGVLRLGYTLYGASAKDCKDWGIPEAERHLFVRLDGAKSNLSLLSGKPRWMKRVSVPIGEGDNAESIGVLEPAFLEERKAEMDLVHLIAKTLAAGGGGKFVRGKAYPLSAVVDDLSETEKGFFGEKSHQARAVKKAMTVHGWDENTAPKTGAGVPQFETPTEFGALAVFIRMGPGGMTFRLAEALDNESRHLASPGETLARLGQVSENEDIFD